MANPPSMGSKSGSGVRSDHDIWRHVPEKDDMMINFKIYSWKPNLKVVRDNFLRRILVAATKKAEITELDVNEPN